MKLKLTTKNQIETRLPEQKYNYANSRSFNVQPHLQQYQCCMPFCFRHEDVSSDVSTELCIYDHHQSLLLPALLNKLMPIKYGIRNGMAGIDAMLLTVSKGLIKDNAMIKNPKKLITI